MNLNSYSDEDDDTDRPDSYWRRRVIALVAGLSLLGVLAWAFSGGGRPPDPAAKSSASGVVPAAAFSGVPSLSPAPTSSSSAQARKVSTRTSRAAPAPAASATALGRGTRPGGTCSPRAVVLSLFTSRLDYAAGQDPDFSVYAVSTASRACVFGTSAAKLYVVVMSSGRVIWNSADCARGPAHQGADLRRGVPAKESVSWDRSISLPGCVKLGPAPRPGTYQVQARTATVASPVRTFKLKR